MLTKTFCDNCVCWDNSRHPNAQQDNVGFCHFFSPSSDPAFFQARFPKTMADDFCFQGEAKPDGGLLQG